MPISADELIALLDDFDWDAWSDELDDALQQLARDVLIVQAERAADDLGIAFDPDDPFVSETMTGYVGERIVQLDETTRDDVIDLIRETVAEAEDRTTFDLGTAIYDAVSSRFDDYARYRADRIARSETAILYNYGAVLGYRQAGVTEVEVSDGDHDDDCAEADGQVWSIEDALNNPTAHPNCTRSFAPIVPDDADQREESGDDGEADPGADDADREE